MPKVFVSDRQRARDKLKKLKVLCLGHKEMEGFSWDYLSKEMDMSRTTLTYRFKEGLLTLDEWIVFLHILKIEREEIDLWIS